MSDCGDADGGLGTIHSRTSMPSICEVASRH